MYCKKCGAEIKEGAKFCNNCGTAVNEAGPVPVESVQTQKPKKKHTVLKVIAGVIIAFIAMIAVLGIIGNNTGDNSSDSHIAFVKGGYPVGYEDVTYGEVFDNFFANPEWKYFESTEGDDVVEFSGGCFYQEAEVTVTLQFTLDLDAGTFEAGYFDMNGVPQDRNMTESLLTEAIDSYRKSDSYRPNTTE